MQLFIGSSYFSRPGTQKLSELISPVLSTLILLGVSLVYDYLECENLECLVIKMLPGIVVTDRIHLRGNVVNTLKRCDLAGIALHPEVGTPFTFTQVYEPPLELFK